MHKLLNRYKTLPVAVKASLWFTICSIITKGIAFITTPIFTRILTTEQFGQYNVFLSWQGIIGIFTSLRLYYGVFNNGMIKYEKDKSGFTSSMIGLTTALTLFISLIFLIFQEPLSAILSMSPFLMMLLLIEELFLSAISLWSAQKRYDFKYRSVVGVTIGIAIANPVLGIIMCLSTNDRGTARIVSSVIVQIVFGLIIYILVMIRGKKVFFWEYWKYALLFNLPLIPHYLSQIVLSQSDRIMIGHFCGNNYVGMYGVAFSLSQVLNIITNSVNSSFVPWQYRKMKENKFEEIAKIANALLLGLAAMLVMFIIVAPELMKIISTPAYYEGVWVIPPLTISLFFSFLYTLFANVEFYYEKRKYVLIASIVSALLNLILNYLFINLFGFIAAAYTTLFCFILYCVAHFFFMNKTLRENGVYQKVYSVSFISKVVIVMLVISTVSVLCYDLAVIRYVLFIIALIIMVIKRKIIISAVKLIRS